MDRAGVGHTVSAWFLGEIRLERYRLTAGSSVPIPPHTHDAYQFGLSLDCPGEYRYRGARHAVPAGALRIIQPGEVHASRDFAEATGASPLLLYVPPGVLGEIAVGAAGRGGAPVEPFFPSPVVLDRELARSHLELCLALGERPASRLEQESRLFATLGRFVARHAAGRFAARAAGREPWAVAEVRAYLDAHVAENVSLRGLANLVGLTPPYLDRAFARAVGLPPHRYQVQRRVERAKALLAAGMPIGAVASETGFADQSHLGRHFKRLVGVSPGRYRARTAPRLGEETTR